MKCPSKDEGDAEMGMSFKDVEVQCVIVAEENVANLCEIEGLFGAEKRKNAELMAEISKMKFAFQEVYSGNFPNFEEFQLNLTSKITEELKSQFDREKSQLTNELAELTLHNDELSCELEETAKTLSILHKEKLDEQSSLRKIIREVVEQSKKANKAFENHKSLYQIQINSLEKKLISRDTRLASVTKELEESRQELKEFRAKEYSQVEAEERSAQPKRLKGHKVKRPVKSERAIMRTMSAFLSLGLSPAGGNGRYAEGGRDEEEKKE